MAVAHVITDQPAKMLLVQRDDMVQDLAAAIPDPAFRDSVLPGRLDARSLGFQTRCFQECDDFTVELRVAVEDDVTIRGSLGKSLTQLLDNPLRSRVSCCVEVQDLAPSVFDDEEALQQFECHGRHGEEIERDDHLAMVLEKGQSAFSRVTPATNSPKIPGHTSFRDDETKLLKFSMDLGCSPVSVLFRQASSQTADFIGDLRTAEEHADSGQD